MSEDSEYSRTPVGIVLVLILLGGIAVVFVDLKSPVIGKVSGWVATVLQITTTAIYLLMIAKYTTDSGLLEEYSPSNRGSVLGGEYGGPLLSLIFEYMQTMGLQQLARVLLIGITFKGWNQSLALTNYLLVTILGLYVLAMAILDIVNRGNDLRYYWEDISERIN